MHSTVDSPFNNLWELKMETFQASAALQQEKW